jgi:predicted metal-binding membrane protein
MALLFAAGVMNLLSVAALAALVLVEQLTPKGRRSAVPRERWRPSAVSR